MMLERTVTIIVACKVVAKYKRDAEEIASYVITKAVKQYSEAHKDDLQDSILEVKVLGNAHFYFDPFTTQPLREED